MDCSRARQEMVRSRCSRVRLLRALLVCVICSFSEGVFRSNGFTGIAQLRSNLRSRAQKWGSTLQDYKDTPTSGRYEHTCFITCIRALYVDLLGSFLQLFQSTLHAQVYLRCFILYLTIQLLQLINRSMAVQMMTIKEVSEGNSME